MTTTTARRPAAAHPSRPGTSDHQHTAEDLIRSVMVDRWSRWAGRRFPVWPPLRATEDQLIEFWADPEMEA